MVADILLEMAAGFIWCRKNTILVNADTVGLYQTIPHQADLEVPSSNKRKTYKVPTGKQNLC